MSGPVASWFVTWLDEHQQYNPGPGWNSYGNKGVNVFEGWVKAFIEHNVIREEAHEASMALMQEPSSYPEHHLSKLLASIRASRVERDRPIEAPPPAAPGSALAALRAVQEAHEAEEARLQEPWDKLDPATKEHYLGRAREAYPHFAQRWSQLITSFARGAWAEDVGLVPRGGDGRSILDSGRATPTESPPGDTPLRPRAEGPPSLTRGEEAEHIARCAERRRVLSEQLQAITPRHTKAS